MRDRMTGVRRWVVDLPRLAKRAVLMTSDSLLLLIAVWLAFSLRLGQAYWPDSWQLWFILLGAPLLGVAFFQAFHLYRIATQFIRDTDTARMYLALGLAVLSWVLLVLMVVGTGDPQFVVPRSVILIYAIFSGVFIRSSRRIAAWLLRGSPLPRATLKDRRPVVIYGAGTAGVQLQEALQGTGDYKPIAFLDDASSLMGQRIGGLKVYPSERIAHFMRRDGVTDVLLAIPDRSRRERKEVYAKLAAHDGLNVRTMPALEDIAAGRVSVTDLRSVELEDLLGRDPVPANAELLARGIRGKSVMVTGAGGSIGAELMRQILRQGPRRLVLFELSETALYEIEIEIAESIDKAQRRRAARPARGACRFSARCWSRPRRAAISRATACKPSTTPPPTSTCRSWSTIRWRACATTRSARRCWPRPPRLGVERFDADLDRQGGAANQHHGREQAPRRADLPGARGRSRVQHGVHDGPLRQRARQLGLGRAPLHEADPARRAGHCDPPGGDALFHVHPGGGGPRRCRPAPWRRGGEVFVLDMGERVKIDELARTMIRLMNRRVLDEANPDGDIEINYVGLRRGEKRYEELLIDENTSATEHPSINQNNEPFLDKAELERELAALEEAMAAGQMDVIDAILMRTVEGYRPDPRQARGNAPDTWPVVSRTLH